MGSCPPAHKMKQIVRITAQRGIGHAPNSLLVQISIDPRYFPAGLFEHTERAARVAQTALLSHMESHRQARSNRL
jgi:hypothetical protein